MSRMPEVGDVVDDVFSIEEELEEGNFGVVFRVRDRRDDRSMALKIHKPTPKDEEELRHRFEREARLIYSLDHPHVVEILYYGETETGLPYMAMEFLHGTDLKQCARSDRGVTPLRIRRISLETLSALRAAHQIGIVHRDLKPSNIFLVGGDETGRVKVLDFGFAKSIDNQTGGDLTSSDTLVGSPAYMAPELVHKQNVGSHSDLYSMGLIIAEMIAGDKIVHADSIYDTLLYQASDDPVELPETVRKSSFYPVVERAVQKDVADRYESADAMMDDLESIQLESRSSNEANTGSLAASSSPPSDIPGSDEPGAEGGIEQLEPDEEISPSPPSRSTDTSSHSEPTPPSGTPSRGGDTPRATSRSSDTTDPLDRGSSRGRGRADGRDRTSRSGPHWMDLILGVMLGLLGLGIVVTIMAYV